MTSPVVTVRYFAAAKAAAGTAQEHRPVGPRTSVAQLVEQLGDGRPELARVLLRCSFLHDEVAVRDSSTVVTDGSVIDVLPPFAGG